MKKDFTREAPNDNKGDNHIFQSSRTGASQPDSV